jgi:hypothetical protein
MLYIRPIREDTDMMVDSKRKGADFERKVVKYLNKKIKSGIFKRVAGSGAIGTIVDEPYLMGDINGEVTGVPRKFKLEAKIGYGGSKQMTLQKEWLDKILEEASHTNAVPGLVGRFSGSRSGMEEFVILSLDDFIYLLNVISELHEDIEWMEEEKWD